MRVTVWIYQDRKGEWRWRAFRGGRIVCDSGEGYTRRVDARRAWTRFSAAVVTRGFDLRIFVTKRMVRRAT